MAKCEVCGKHPMSGHHVSFSQHHTKRKWKVNIQKTTIYVGGKLKKVKICSRCLRTSSKTE